MSDFAQGMLFVLAFEAFAIAFGLLTKQLKFEWWRGD